MNKNLKLLRDDLGLSQKEFGNKLNVTDTTISKWESGVRNLTDRTITQICDTFNVNYEWFMSGEGNMYRTIDDLNIANMMNKSKGDYAYTLLDVDTPVTKEVAAKLEAIEGVLKVRVVK